MKELDIALKTLDEHKAENIESIDVTNHNPFASYIVLATCPNTRALGAMAELLEDAFEKEEVVIRVKEGQPDSGWMIVEAGEVIVHLLLDVNRRELKLEDLLSRLNEKSSKIK